MYGSRAREDMRQAVRRSERSSQNARQHVKKIYAEICTKRKMVPQMRFRLQDVHKRMAVCRGPSNIRRYMLLKEQAEKLEREIKYIEDDMDARQFFERTRPLIERTDNLDTNNEQKREALAMALFHPDKAVPVFIQTDRCTHCGVDLKMDDEESVLVCPQCRRTTKYLNLSTDHVDVDYVAQDTHVNHINSTMTGNVDNTKGTDESYPKASLYQKFLMQFSENVPEPPEEVLEVIERELHKVHILHNSKVQTTPVGNILRKKGYKDWAWMSTRISMMLKKNSNEVIPLFSNVLIERLLKRFDFLIDAMKRSRCRNKSKAFNFRFLTKVFLTLEGEYAMSELFENHKTRTVLRREDMRVGQLCRMLRQEAKDNGFDWDFFRSL